MSAPQEDALRRGSETDLAGLRTPVLEPGPPLRQPSEGGRSVELEGRKTRAPEPLGFTSKVWMFLEDETAAASPQKPCVRWLGGKALRRHAARDSAGPIQWHP